MKTEIVSINKIQPNPDNPRVIRDSKFKKLVKSIQDFPQMLEIRPLVVDENMMILGGNMRLRACIEAGLTEVHVFDGSFLTEDQRKEFIIKDNVGFGEWDWDKLANEWDEHLLKDWGLDLPTEMDIEDVDGTDEKIDYSRLMTLVVVAYEEIEDLDKITSLYQLDSIDITNEIKGQLGSLRKVYVFK